MTEKEQLAKIIRLEEAFCMAFEKISSTFKKCNTDIPKKILRNELTEAIIALYTVGEILEINIDEGLEFITKEANEKKGKSNNDE